MQLTRSMDSQARVAGPPIHPLLVAFPVALFAATVGALLAFIGTHDTLYYRAAMTAGAAGVTMAVLGAIPGLLDLLARPQGSAARAMGVKHASYAALVVSIFAASTAVMVRNWFAKVLVDGAWQLDATVPLAIGVAGLVTLVIVGILGWTVGQTPLVRVQERRSVAAAFPGRLAARH